MSFPSVVYGFPPFRGVDFKDAPLNTPPQFARRAKFIEFDLLGAISKAEGLTAVNETQIAANPAVLGLYEYIQKDGDKFFIAYTGNGKLYKVSYADGTVTDITPANVVIAPNVAPHFFTFNNICMFGDGINPPIYLHAGVTSATIFELGVTAPPSALSAGVGAAGVLTGNYSYKVVFVSSTGAKSNASAASNVVTLAAQQANLTLIPINVDLAENVVSREIYRTDAGGSIYYFLTLINDNVTTTYIDNIADTALGERLEEENEKPPAGTFGFAEYNGSVYAYQDNSTDLLYSKINQGESFGVFNVEPISDGDGEIITGLGLLDTLVVFKQKSIHTWEGIPGFFKRRTKSKSVGCISRNTIKNVTMPDGGDVLFFLSRGGVCAFDGQDPYLISREVETIFNGRDANYVFNVARAKFATAEYDAAKKKYTLSIAVNGSSDNNLQLIFDVYAQSWSIKEIYSGSLVLRTSSGGLLELIGGDSRSDVVNGGRIFKSESGTSKLGANYSGEYVTTWNSLEHPHNVKLLRYIELDIIAQGNYNLTVDVYLNGEDIPTISQPVSLSTGGGVWDVDNWDEVNFAGDTYITAKFGLGKRQARFISLGFRTDEKDKPWKVLAVRVEFQILPPAGDRK